MSVHWKVERFLRQTEMKPTQFGRLAAGDPRLVFDLRRGREVGARLSARLEAFIATRDIGQ